jgi:hypothetical protein
LCATSSHFSLHNFLCNLSVCMAIYIVQLYRGGGVTRECWELCIMMQNDAMVVNITFVLCNDFWRFFDCFGYIWKFLGFEWFLLYLYWGCWRIAVSFWKPWLFWMLDNFLIIGSFCYGIFWKVTILPDYFILEK